MFLRFSKLFPGFGQPSWCFVLFAVVFVSPVLLSSGQRVGGGSQTGTRAQDQCNKTVALYTEVASPAVTAENRNKPMLCRYSFRPLHQNLRDWVLKIRFTKFKVGKLANASHCDEGYLQIIDGSSKTGVGHRHEAGKFCGEIEQTQVFISETNVVKVVFYVDNFTEQTYFRFDTKAEQQLEVYQRYGQQPEMYPHRRGEMVPGTYCERVFRDCRTQTCYVQSPAYPGIYPRNLHCKYHINTRLPFTKLHIENEDFNVDGQRCENLILCPMKPIGSDCPFDYIRIYDGRDEKSPVIGTFCGVGKFPHDIIGTSEDLFVEFVTSPAGPLLNTGFHFNVAHWPIHAQSSGKKNGTCDWEFTSTSLEDAGDKQGLFWSVSHWYPPKTTCSYLMRGRPDEIVRLNFPSFRIDKIQAPIQRWDGECGESLTIYDADWPDDSKIIKTFCDTFSRPLEKYDFISTQSSLFVRFESKTGSFSGSSLYYWAHYDFFNNTHYGEPVKNSICDEKFYSWSKPFGRFTSPTNTLVFKNTGKPIVCKYQFVSNKREYARVVVRIDNVNFKFSQDSCTNCWGDRVDKVLLVDPKRNASGICLCRENHAQQSFPVNLISKSEEAEVVLRVDTRHAMSNYFKTNNPIFEGSYKFIHGPLCGPTTLGPAPGGKLRFPFYENQKYKDHPVSCLWEFQVSSDKDLWIRIDKLVFSSSTKSCSDAKLEFFLQPTVNQSPAMGSGTGGSSPPFHTYKQKQSVQPLLTFCGESSLKDSKTELSSLLPILQSQKLQQGGTFTIRLEASAASRVQFLLSWTELLPMPRNPDGSLMTAKMIDENPKGDCEFACPGPEGVCIPRVLVCNGVINCPSNSSGPNDESEIVCKQSADKKFIAFNFQFNISWMTAAFIGALLSLLLCLCCVFCIRCFRRKADDDDY